MLSGFQHDTLKNSYMFFAKAFVLLVSLALFHELVFAKNKDECQCQCACSPKMKADIAAEPVPGPIMLPAPTKKPMPPRIATVEPPCMRGEFTDIDMICPPHFRCLNTDYGCAGFVSIERKWDDTMCPTGFLVPVYDDNVVEIVKELLRLECFEGEVWFNAQFDDGSDNIWEDMYGGPLSPFEVGKLGDGGENLCGTIDHTGKFNVRDCYTKLPYVCYWTMTKT